MYIRPHTRLEDGGNHGSNGCQHAAGVIDEVDGAVISLGCGGGRTCGSSRGALLGSGGAVLLLGAAGRLGWRVGRGRLGGGNRCGRGWIHARIFTIDLLLTLPLLCE